MRIERLDYKVPVELIAQNPVSPRDKAKMMVLDRKTGDIQESTFSDISHFLKRGDVLVFNNTKVFPARVYGQKKTGGKIEAIFLTDVKPKYWEVIIGGKVKIGDKIIFGPDFEGTVVSRKENISTVYLNLNSKQIFQKLEKYGHIPLPPYIKRKDKPVDKKDYQTVFAQKIGSAAAPTAGLHFTKKLIDSLKKMGVQILFVDLKVGLGTFAPVKTEKVEDHPIHEEHYEINIKTSRAINRAKKENRRIIAVGTTVVRTLESAAKNGSIEPQKGKTNLFIYPGFRFQIIDGLITNFHTPRSSLLALVYGFAGENQIKKAYALAIEKKYRFFSYGDGMLII